MNEMQEKCTPCNAWTTLIERGLTAGVLAVLAAASPAFAQDSSRAGPQKSDQAAPSAQIEEIIVTAQRREENLQTVPIAITTVSSDLLRVRNIYDSQQLQVLVPSLQMEGVADAVGAINFFIRGVGSALDTVAGEASVATVLDGVVMGRPEMGVVQYFDLQQIEVLRVRKAFFSGRTRQQV